MSTDPATSSGNRGVPIGILGLAGAAAAAGLAWTRGSIPRTATFDANLAGKIAIVTGSNSGIGKETALALGQFGATVIMACRSIDKAEASADDLRDRSPGIKLVVLQLDLSDLASVRAFAREFLSRFDRLDILVNNAGRVVAELRHDGHGIEATFATNHLGPFLLTDLLLPRLVETGRTHEVTRIVNVASSAHRQGDIDLDDLMWQRRPYKAMRAYATSKLLNVLFTMELSRRTDHNEVTVNCLHPGNIHTGFGVADDAPRWMQVLFPLSREVFLTPARGADTSVWLAASDAAAGQHGGYFFRRRRWSPSKTAQDPELARAVWDASAGLI